MISYDAIPGSLNMYALPLEHAWNEWDSDEAWQVQEAILKILGDWIQGPGHRRPEDIQWRVLDKLLGRFLPRAATF